MQLIIHLYSYVTVNKDHIFPAPKGLSSEIEAGAIPEVWLTAFKLLRIVGNVKAGDRVLIHAAASGVGTALIQLCKKFGATTIAVSSTDEKLFECKV